MSFNTFNNRLFRWPVSKPRSKLYNFVCLPIFVPQNNWRAQFCFKAHKGSYAAQYTLEIKGLNLYKKLKISDPQRLFPNELSS